MPQFLRNLRISKKKMKPKSNKPIKTILTKICLLVTVGMLFILPTFYIRAEATNDGLATTTTGTDSELTGTTTTRTNIDEPGSSDSHEDLSELNIANSLTITTGGDNGSINGTLRILITLTLIALAPTLLLMLTSYTRIIIVLHFTRAALNTQTAPPNQVLIGLALFLTFFIMRPTLTQVYTESVVPFENGEITQEEFFETAMNPLREFMYGQTQTKDVRMFLDIEGIESVESLDDIPTHTLVPAFMVSELRTAFIIGFLIYIPFIIIDMVVASTLMSMGMMMLPPTTISMPFKILLFVLADGWNLVIVNLVRTFY